MKKLSVLLILGAALVAALGLTRPSVRQNPGAGGQELNYIRTAFSAFSQATAELCTAIDRIDSSDNSAIARSKAALIRCRLSYKKIEFFLEYFFHSSALIYNNPAKYEVEEPYMEFEAPRGFQVIEALLFAQKPQRQKAELMQQATAVHESADGLDALLYDFSLQDGPLLESLRIELIRIMTLGIAGYDAPLLRSGIAESYEAMLSMAFSLRPYLAIHEREADSVRYYIGRCLTRLRANPGFNRFDRMAFLTRAALPLQYHLGLFIRQSGLELNTVPALNYRADQLFARDALNRGVFPGSGKGLDDAPVLLDAGAAGSDAMATGGGAAADLGRRLFFETALSGNGSRSCATCHQPGHYFTDQLPKSIAYDGHSTVKRNAPSLFYAAFQYSQFWDGRAKTLEEQVIDVLNNPVEMNAELPVIEHRLQHNSSYAQDFCKAFPEKKDSPIAISQVAIAIAAYVRTLSPMKSPFDRYIAGDQRAMTEDQIDGFNLFMGKAQCATCHFAPLFNGLRPPLYDLTEYETLGVPATDDLHSPRQDGDSGRFGVYPIPFYKQAFKTPTLRNVAVTAPYMHNGNMHSLEKVMEFYNKGGGRGLGLTTPQQTLPAEPLHLSAKEIQQIILFLHALTDAQTPPLFVSKPTN